MLSATSAGESEEGQECTIEPNELCVCNSPNFLAAGTVYLAELGA
ncbi:hypothetical protein [Citricoccus muralis]|uniref:Uncharacterized protein n=1 Tax=Citricoccus muralis TaxID=169134 RepID=A0A3D9LCC6_9MICC|nr:hypothetical protein [Citricoccus muralis]REE04049.1 hypothetical protein C8E99_1874 [Citricoccus muralis]